MDDKKLEYYDVRVEASVPCALTYKVSASSPEEAIEMIKTRAPQGFQPFLARKRLTSAKVFRSGSIMVVATKKFGS